MAPLPVNEHPVAIIVGWIRRAVFDRLRLYERGRRFFDWVALRAGEKITSGFRIPSSRHLRPLLNHEILTVARLRLRFRSIVATESDANPGANSRKLFFRRP